MRCARLPLRWFPLASLSFLLLFALVPPAGAGPAGRVVESEIDRVTVYARNAHVTRTAKVDLTAGIHTVVFDKLPLETHSDALGCHVEGEARVLGIRIERRIYAEPVEERIRALENELAGVTREIEDLDAELRVLDQKHEFLSGVRAAAPKAIAEVASAPGVNPIAHLRGALGFVTAEWTALERERLAVRRRQDELKRRHGRLEAEIQNLRTPSPELHTRLEAHVEVEALRSGPVRLELSYLVGGASWRPYYDARLDRAAREVSWSSYAEIHQASGEDWEGVELAVSTADPLRSTAAPELQPIFLAAGTAPPPPPGTETTLARTQQRDVETHTFKEQEIVVESGKPIEKGRADTHHTVSPQALRQLPADNVNEAIALKAGVVSEGGETHFRGGRDGEVALYEDGIITGGYEAGFGNATPPTLSVAALSRTATATLYRIERRESVPADGSWHRVTVATHRLPVELEVLAVPRKARSAYLRARGANATGALLLAGPVHLFSGGDYLGTGSLPGPVAPGAPMALSFGSLDRLKVEHELVSEERSRSRGDSRLRYHYRIRIANFDDTAQHIVVLDQVPVPVDTRIEVQIERVTPQPVVTEEDPRGVLRWQAELAPGATQAIDLEYEVRFPKEWQVAGL